MTRMIVIDCTPYGPEPSGARRRGEEILRRLPGLLPDDVFEVHWAADGGGPPADLAAENLVHATVAVSCRGGARRWFRRGRDLVRRRRDAAFTHLLTDHGPVVAPEKVCNLVTLHDLRFLHGYGGRARALYGRFAYGRSLRRAAGVIAVAPSVAAEAIERYGLDARRVHVAANAVGAAFHAEAAGERTGALVVARDEPRKARGAAVAAARETGVGLTIVDGGLDDAGLREAYARARWLLAPSLLEGYGMPVAEALACGTPVIATDIAAHRDVVALGARGVVLVPTPRKVGGAWSWPEAVRALGEAPPTELAAPTATWDEAAACIAAAIRDAAS